MGNSCAKICCYDTYLERQRKIEELSLQLQGLRLAVGDVTTDLIYLTNSELELNLDVEEKRRMLSKKIENLGSVIEDLSHKIEVQKNGHEMKGSIDDMETLVDDRGHTHNFTLENEEPSDNQRLLQKYKKE